MMNNDSFFDTIPFANDQFEFDLSSFEVMNDVISEFPRVYFEEEDGKKDPDDKQIILNHKKRKLTPRNRYYTPSLRVVKSDIRRSYMAMYFNVINSSDSSLLRSYLTRFYHPNCQWNVNFTKNLYPNRIYSYGIENIAASFGEIFERIPDYLMKSSDVSMLVSYDFSKSQIVAKCKVLGTKVYSVSIPKTLPYNATTFPTSVEYLSYNTNNICDSEVSVYKKKLDRPTVFTLEGQLTMLLDEDYRIRSLESIFTTCQEIMISL